MNDYSNKRDFRDRISININEPNEVQYWCARFGVSPFDLILAVALVGPMVPNVRTVFLKR